MKKSLLIIPLLCCSMVLMAQNAQQNKDQKPKGAHPYKVEENEEVAEGFSHWSMILHAGFNAFDGDFNSEMKHPIGVPSAGLDIEYAFTPVWALGIEYMFDWYQVTGKPTGDNADKLLNGYMHKPAAYISMDFINLFFPNAKKKIFGMQAIAGGGYGFYRNTDMYPDEYRYHTGSHEPLSMDKYKGAAFLKAGLNLEFNLNRTLSLGVRATYDYFINDYPDGRGYAGMQSLASKNNDGIVDVTLNMRFKFGAVSKTHVRNISNPDVWAKKPELQPQVQCVHDTVIIQHDSIIVRERIIESQKIKQQDQIYYVYFDNNKSALDEKGLITIQQVADRLNADSTLYAVVTGFCDNTGSAQLNYALGDKRAENVIGELSEEHGIDTTHLYSMGMGKLVGRRSQAAYGPNRRAVIRLVDKATFERMKLDLDDQRANRVIEEEEEPVQVAPVKTVPLQESAKPAKKTNTYKLREGETVTTDQNTTLSKLARKYYNNTYCWVYIYIANKEKIKNPNALVPGTKLTIPELTQQEMRITKDQSLVLYSNARQGKK